jgi:acyl-CoA hydrolase
MASRTPSDSHSLLVRWMGPTDANAGGFIHGGTIMRYCDEAAGLAAVRHSGTSCVTAGLDRMTFNERVHVGDVVSFKATVNAAWNTSVEVGVRVEAENARTGEVRHTTTAYLTMVAIGDDGRPAAVPALECESDTERRREREAQLRRKNRLAEREQIVQSRSAEPAVEAS